MQLSIKQQVKLDLAIERYTDDIAMKDGKVKYFKVFRT